MLDFILWYLSISLVGITIFPLSYRLLPGLPDRGYAFSRALGLLSWGYIFWLFTSLQILRNNPGGLLLALGIILALGYWAARGISRQELLGWWRERKKLVIGVEVLFLLAFAAWAFVRSSNPEIQFTEKPMELAFINAILHSPEFPPHDPWLSGYAISYYYFGYVLVAMVAKITAVPGSIAFNLGIALVFALSAIGAYGLVYDLLEVWRSKRQTDDVAAGEGRSPDARHHWILAFFGPLYVLIASNLEGFLDVLHARGLFWKVDPSGQLTSAFWKWLDMKELSQPPVQPLSWMPARFLWWWRASRVLQDYDLAGNWREVIDEFPFFSYLLADLHPHVLAMPFALVAIAIALNVFLVGGQGRFRLFNFRLDIGPQFLALAGVALGGLAFLNTWDFPIYVALFSGAYILFRSRQRSWGWFLFPDFFLLSFVLGIIGVLLYLPFYMGFSSQAGGILPNLIYVTRGAHLWVMFGPFFFLLFAYLLHLWRCAGRKRLGKGLLLAVGFTLFLFACSLLMGFGIIQLPVLGDLFLGSIGATGQVGELFQQAFTRRLIDSGGWITLVALLALSLGLLWPKLEDEYGRAEGDPINPMENSSGIRGSFSIHDNLSLSHIFVILLILVGTLLVLAPEFFFLRDQFGYRINTIFKFYYQAWILWSVAGAFGTAVLLNELRGLKGTLFSAGLVVVLGASLVYPALSLWTKTNSFDPPQGFNLDGTAYFEQQSPDEIAGIRWLSSAPPGVVAEAVGGSYTEYARVATQSGQPTVLGWPGHESQWRGGAEEMGSRQSDIEQLYRTSDWNDAQEILRQYNIRYVYIGSLERSTYVVNEAKFKRFLTPVFQQGQVTIYEVPLTMTASSP